MTSEELIAEIRDGHERQDRPEGEPPMCLACSPLDWPCDAVRAAAALEAATRERAAVPDAANERDLRSKLSRAYRQRDEEREAKKGNIRALNKALAERDAALAAIKRVKKLLGPMRNRLDEYGEVPLRHAVSKTLESLAALDGAPEPEPEWEYGFELIEPDDRNVFDREGDFGSAKFAYRAAKKRIDAEHQADLPRLQYAIVRRLKAGPWLPVEGESRP